MEAGRRVRNHGLALAGVLVLLPLPAATAPAADATAEPQLHLLLRDPLGRETLRIAALGAAARMSQGACRQVFADFEDGEGHSLQTRLDEQGQTPTGWLGMVVFADASHSPHCRPGVMAFTEPGGRAIRVCPSFALTQKSDPSLAEIVLIHELLHTLGLEENPPTSREITSRVTERCGR